MQKFGQTYHAPATVLLISGDVNFAPVLHDLRYTSNFQILLLHNVQASQNFIQFAHEAYRFDLFIADLPDKFGGKPPQVGCEFYRMLIMKVYRAIGGFRMQMGATVPFMMKTLLGASFLTRSVSLIVILRHSFLTVSIKMQVKRTCRSRR